jgi:hypothetical protein
MLALVEGGFGLIGGLLCLTCMAGCGGMAFQAIRGLTHRASKDEVGGRLDGTSRAMLETDGYREAPTRVTQGPQSS